MIRKVSHQVLKTVLHSSGREVKYRPMQGREEKLLLIAKESGEDTEILSTVKQIVDNCLLDDVSVDKMPIFDIEWLFIQIRIASVSPISTVSYRDHSDGQTYTFDVDLTKIEVVKPAAESVLKLGDDLAVELRWPGTDSFIDKHVVDAESDADAAHALGIFCVNKIYDGDSIIMADDHSFEELDEFVSSFDIESYKKLIEWVSRVPVLKYVIEYTNSAGEEREIVLSSLTDFFRFR